LESTEEKELLENLLDLPLTVSLNLLSEDYVEEVELKEFHLLSMMIQELFLEVSSNKLSEMLLHTLNTQEERQLQLWMLFMLSKDKVELYTVSDIDYHDLTIYS
jgi:hypothetical protein